MRLRVGSGQDNVMFSGCSSPGDWRSAVGKQLSCPRPSPDLFSSQIWVVQILFEYEGRFQNVPLLGFVFLGCQ